MVYHERNCISNRRPLKCLFNSCFTFVSTKLKEHQRSPLLSFLWNEYTDSRWIPLTSTKKMSLFHEIIIAILQF